MLYYDYFRVSCFNIKILKDKKETVYFGSCRSDLRTFMDYSFCRCFFYIDLILLYFFANIKIQHKKVTLSLENVFFDPN